MKMIKKAQTATEYLIILAVVIVIALVVASLLGGFPGIGGNIGTNTNKGYWITTDVTIPKFSVGSTGTATLVLQNNLAETITITSIETCTTKDCGTVTGVNGADEILSTGDETTYTVSDVNVSAVSPGDRISFYVRMNYTDSLDATYSVVGSKPIETTIATS